VTARQPQSSSARLCGQRKWMAYPPKAVSNRSNEPLAVCVSGKDVSFDACCEYTALFHR
jgi:hypothetical protein